MPSRSSLRSFGTGAGVGAMPVVAALVIATGAAGLLEGTGVVSLPGQSPDASLVVPAAATGDGTLVASADRDVAPVATPDAADDASAPAGGTRPAADEGPRDGAAPASTVRRRAGEAARTPDRRQVVPTTTAPARPTPSEPAAVPATMTSPTLLEDTVSAVKQARVGEGVRATTDALAGTTNSLTDGLSNALGGKQQPLGAVVGGLGDTVGDAVRGLGNLLGYVLGAGAPAPAPSPAATPSAATTPSPDAATATTPAG
ncbi:hypothetical protein SK069_15575 [Patulibacter brassicae]|jgi:hypothetical protein|uniref:Uncharacterized protein n=1 Tax=Patulibacter brassicae TaxID=1705717 RepID=A0ABU4VPN5_9ACTN|nr:hypothetical protein [Patulibacter brassicae]MDX8153019.1 hypothetical protein [Patulibacter brassicae]